MLLDDYIKKDLLWSELPTEVQIFLNNDEEEYDARILVYFLQNQLEYGGKLITKRKIVGGLKITPFGYYRSIVYRTMLAESSYDRIPNFTAAACYQVLGIGRNEYIDLLNTYKGLICSPQSDLKEPPSVILNNLLPKVPLDCKTLEPWFIVRVGSVSLNDVESSRPEEKALLDKIIDNDVALNAEARELYSCPGLRVSDVPIELLQQLYRRGLIYFDVPIFDDDCISVPTLDGFIMNRITGDSCETMLYKIFVSLDPRSCVRDLAVDLGVQTEFVRNAASIFCRLGFAQKSESKGAVHVSFDNPSSEDPCGNIRDSQGSLESPAHGHTDVHLKKIAFIFDSTITAYLMLGNLSADLKKHSVTMFEVGKLTGHSLEAFYKKLSAVSQLREQDVGIYYEHARCLSETMCSIARSYSVSEDTTSLNLDSFDLLRCGSLESLEPVTRSRILTKNYDLLVCMAPLSYEEAQVFDESWPLVIGPPTSEASSPWFRFFVCCAASKAGTQLSTQTRRNFGTESCTMPGMLLCRGSRLDCLPAPLSCFSHFLVTSWDHDPVFMDIYTLFNAVNDLILTSPVFIQAYDDEEDGDPLLQRFLPLPLSQKFLEESGKNLRWLRNLSEKVDLTSLVGFLSLLVPDSTEKTEDSTLDSASAARQAPAYQANTSQFFENTLVNPRAVISESEFAQILASGRPICLLTMHMGIPLFNLALNKAVFAGITTLSSTGEEHNGLLSSGMRGSLSKANKMLRSQLRTFIREVGGMYVKINSSYDATGTAERKNIASTWPLPTKSYCCTDDGLSIWNE
ncbi:unnamed protein product [Schistocephalus solidus]|uniref:Protein FAM91A1 n=1 Tax=Schistocephalus solidus TaxID=70667 RepID=A0A183S9T8_SCHSO|nr:unnamed protein product [Schistocephalus solidus]